MRPVVAAAWVLALAASASAAEIKPLADLYSRVPELPADAREAAAWFDKDGKLVHPGLLAIKAELEARKRDATPPEKTDAKGVPDSMQPMVKGMQDVGIDAARMRSDPAYAAEIKARMMKMSPQEQMAMVQKMTQPMNQANLRDTVAMSQESPAVQAAVEKAKGWNDAQVARLKSHGTLWSELEAATNRVTAKPFGLTKPAIEYDSPGCDGGCQAQWQAYGKKLWPLVIAREDEVLQVRRPVVQRDRAAIAALVQEGDTYLVPIGFGAAAKSTVDRTWLNGYHVGIVDQIDQLVTETETIAKRAAGIVNDGVEKFYWQRGR